MQRVNICSIDPSISRALQSTLACCQLTSGPHWWQPILVQSWPKVLRITQIYIFTKSSASVCMMAICIYYEYKYAWSLSEFWGFCLPLEDWPQVPNGIKVWGVSWPWTQNIDVLFPEPLITFALWQGAPSCWKSHCSSPNCSWMVGRSSYRRMCWYHSLFMAVFLGKIVSEPSPLAEKQPHTWMVSGCFTVGMTQDWW